MATKTVVHPPQTYSRLFRPWDGKESQGNLVRDRIEEALRERIDAARGTSTDSGSYYCASDSDSEQTIKSEPIGSDYATSPAKASRVEQPGVALLDPSLMHYPSADVAAYYQYCYQQHQHQLAEHPAARQNLPELLPTHPAAIAGPPNGCPTIDPLAFTYDQMEQEYLRVLSEDAKAKLLASRKQRPKKFKCPHCDVAFSNNGQLKGHIRIHTGKCPGGRSSVSERR
uniref:Uncharacterized protein n=1 Tax=Anopheles albimanus TaxID=7167 RepID=A0A182FAM1_ANOAL